MVEDELAPFFDETMTFDFDITSEYQLDTQKAYLEVWDSDLGEDQLIGGFEMDLGFLWRQDNHELYRRWLSLSDTTGTYLGVQGYLRVTACLLPEGAEPKTVRDDISEGDELKDVLMGSSIETIESIVRVDVFKAEGLPDMDRTGGDDGKRCDPFVAVKCGGILGSTLHQDRTTSPQFNESLTIPVKQPKYGPHTSGVVRISVFDHDENIKTKIAETFNLSAKGDGFLSKAIDKVESATGVDVDGDGALGAEGQAIEGALEDMHDLVGSTDIDFEEIAQHWKRPSWVNLYGPPQTAKDLLKLKNLTGEAKRVAKQMTSGDIEATAYRGRVLVSADVKENVPEPKLLCEGQLPIPRKRRKEPPQTVPFRLRVCVLEGVSLPNPKAGSENNKLKVEVRHGVASPIETRRSNNRREEGSKGNTGSSEWFAELDIEAHYPNDITQIPDVFINILGAEDKRLSYIRIPVLDKKTKSINRNDLWDLDDMHNFDGLHKASWYTLKRDVFGPLGKSDFPGLLSVCIGFGRVDGKTPIGNRMQPTSPMLAPTLSKALLGSSAGGPAEAVPGDDPEEEIKKLKTGDIPRAQEKVEELKPHARERLTVTVKEAVGLVDEAAFGGAIDSFVQITAASQEYPRGDSTTKRCETSEGGGTHPKYKNETLVFEEVELVS